MDNKVLVLYYHRVSDQRDDFNQLCVTPVQFYQQMKYLKACYPIFRMEDDWNLETKNGVVITFDDGYKDNLQHALPILEELQIPATIFVTVGNMTGNKEFWWDELERLLLDGDNMPDAFKICDELYDYQWYLGSNELKTNCYRSIHYLMKRHLSYEGRENWMKQLYEWRELKRKTRSAYEPVNQKDLLLLSDSQYITIGAHTMTHPCLAALGKDEQKREIEESILYLKNILNKGITIFSYPFGQYLEDFNEITIQICKDAGIEKAVSTMPGVWGTNSHEYMIPRNAVRNWDLFTFREKINKMWED